MTVEDRSVPIYLTWGEPIVFGNTAFSELTFDAVLHEGHDISSEVTVHPVESGINVADHVRPNPIHISIQGIISDTPIGRTDPNFSSNGALISQQDAFTRSPLTLQPYADPGNMKPRPDPPGSLPPVIYPPTPALAPLLSPAGVLDAATDVLFGSGPFTIQYPADRNFLDPTNYSVTVDQIAGGNPRKFVAEALQVLTSLRDQATLITVIAPHKGPYKNMVLRSIHFDRTTAQGGSANFSLELQEIRIVQSASVAAPVPAPPQVHATPPVNDGAQAPVVPAKQSIFHAAVNGVPTTSVGPAPSTLGTP